MHFSGDLLGNLVRESTPYAVAVKISVKFRGCIHCVNIVPFIFWRYIKRTLNAVLVSKEKKNPAVLDTNSINSTVSTGWL